MLACLIWSKGHGKKRNLTCLKCHDVSETMSGILSIFHTSSILGMYDFSQFIFDHTRMQRD